MILPDVVLPSRVNQRWANTGIDTLENCLDPDHFRSYEHDVQYEYNSRGFRDDEWPTDTAELAQAIWCVGDSFTVGVGSPRSHTWPWMLQLDSGVRTINVGMDGASNNWIARQAVQILEHVRPEKMIIHWSYLHRREGFNEVSDQARVRFLKHYQQVRAPDWPDLIDVKQFCLLPAAIQQELLTQHDQSWRQGLHDEQLRLWHIGSDLKQDINNTVECVAMVDNCAGSARIVHSFIPAFAMGHEQDFYNSLRTAQVAIPHFQPLDLARDGHHYDIKTCRYFVDRILPYLN
jgi:hypothetical protein